MPRDPDTEAALQALEAVISCLDRNEPIDWDSVTADLSPHSKQYFDELLFVHLGMRADAQEPK